MRQYYEIRGDGEPVVLLHGGFATINTWAAQASVLAEHYRVHLLERRGHGRSPDVAGPTGFDLMAADTMALLDDLGVESAHLVGWSDGAMVGMEIALARPDLVRSLVFIGGVVSLDGYTEESRDDVEHLTPDGLPAGIRPAYDRLSPDGPEHFPVVFEKLIKLWRTQPRHPLSDLERVSARTLVMLGDHDGVTVEHAVGIQRAIRDAQLAVVPGTGHGLPFEKPDLVNRLIRDFLADVLAAR